MILIKKWTAFKWLELNKGNQKNFAQVEIFMTNIKKSHSGRRVLNRRELIQWWSYLK